MHKKLRKHLKRAKKHTPAIIEGVLAAFLVFVLGYMWISHQVTDRIPPHVRTGLFPVGGLLASEVPQAMDAYEKEFGKMKMTVAFRGAESTRTFRELGIELDKEKTTQRIQSLAGRGFYIRRMQIVPVAVFHDEIALQTLYKDFAHTMVIPQNPTLLLDAGGVLRLVPAKSGEHIDSISLDRDITEALSHIPLPTVHASAVAATPELSLADIEPTRIYAQSLLASGFHLLGPEAVTDIVPSAVAQMIGFTTDRQPKVQFDDAKLREYLATTVVPKVQKIPINAKFEIVDGKVSQFALPEEGRTLDADATVLAIAEALAGRVQAATIAMQTVKPIVAGTEDSEKLGITTLLATGESDFKGSPKNRTHNIHVGASRYHGILIAPNEEFSFLSFLGPVDREAGYLPELVIKNNKTIPEFGGGLCQVSSTVFRAAAQSGMKITSRRNHSYAVRYYGTPGFDATIYPPYTDFRFLNNTPGYILIQVKIEDTKLSFEFWGTSDNRNVEIDGPHPYNYQPDGSVKSILKQKVTRDGETIIDDTFRSNYKSPNLFPHA